MLEGSASAGSADTSTPSPTEKHDHMKPIESDDEGDTTYSTLYTLVAVCFVMKRTTITLKRIIAIVVHLVHMVV